MVVRKSDESGGDTDGLAMAVARVSDRRARRDERLAALSEEAEASGDYRRYDTVAADLREQAGEDLDALLDAAHRHLAAAAPDGVGRGVPAVSAAPGASGWRAEWVAAGFSTDEAAAWVNAGYGIADAQRWEAAGISTPQLASEWTYQGFTPENASAWTSIDGMTPSEAMSAVNAGRAPIDVERVRRADPEWTRPPDPVVAAPDMGPWL